MARARARERRPRPSRRRWARTRGSHSCSRTTRASRSWRDGPDLVFLPVAAHSRDIDLQVAGERSSQSRAVGCAAGGRAAGAIVRVQSRPGLAQLGGSIFWCHFARSYRRSDELTDLCPRARTAQCAPTARVKRHARISRQTARVRFLTPHGLTTLECRETAASRRASRWPGACAMKKTRLELRVPRAYSPCQQLYQPPVPASSPRSAPHHSRHTRRARHARRHANYQSFAL